MPFGSGLSAQAGFGQETTVGTVATVDHFYEHDEAVVDVNQNWAESLGLHAGGQAKRAARVVQTTRDAKGAFKADVTTRKFGLLFRNMLGSPITAPTQVGATTAYKAVHYLGNATGLGMTMQIGKPGVDGTVNPFTYPGVKVADWELSCKESELLKLALTLDAWDELTLGTTPAGPALTAASYATPSETFNFTECVIKLGGTATTTSSVTSIAGGTSMSTLVRMFTLKGVTGLANARFGLNPTKREQIQNAYTATTLTLDCEMQARTEIYDVFRAGTVTPVQITFTGSQIGTSGNYNTVDIILPGCKIKKAAVQGNGQQLSNQPVEIEVLDDTTNNVVQVAYTSADTTN